MWVAGVFPSAYSCQKNLISCVRSIQYEFIGQYPIQCYSENRFYIIIYFQLQGFSKRNGDSIFMWIKSLMINGTSTFIVAAGNIIRELVFFHKL